MLYACQAPWWPEGCGPTNHLATQSKASAQLRIGTSGWSYGDWGKSFYPSDISQKDFLSFYSENFETVEINNTFYHLPTERAVKNWHKVVEKNFIFSVKISRYITHIKKLKCDKESIQFFIERIKFLKKKLGCILIQLPPSFGLNEERLHDFFSMLPKKKRYSIEFRNESWFTKSTLELLRKFNIALCISDIKRYPLWLETTADFVYIRLHGSQKAYKGEYGSRGLKPWFKRIKEWSDKGLDVYCYFDNDEKGYAVADAKRLRHMIDK